MENDTVKHFKPLVDLETGLHWEKKRKCWYITDHDKFFFSLPHYQIRQAAREMGERAFKERLKQIKMSEYDAEVYMAFYNNIKREVQSTRVVLDSLQAKGMS